MKAPKCVVSLVMRGMAIVALLLAGWSPAAQAMVIHDDPTATSNPSVYTSAPVDDPGWDYVGRFGEGAGVYLGNGWVLTARHFGLASSIVLGGQTFQRDTSVAAINLTNPNPSEGNPDLRLVKILGDPGLTPLPIALTAPTSGTDVVMIGHGRIRDSELKQIIAPPPGPGIDGYDVSSSVRQQTWGANAISHNTALTTVGSHSTYLMRATFDQVLGNAQATVGDSGGGVFAYNSILDQWELVGLMIGVTSFVGQTDDTVAFGNQTLIADLSIYRDQIMAIVIPEPGTAGLLVAGAVLLLRRRCVHR